ncbi:hemicentin-2-like isoform X2 [Channa argus]|uniref:hemicentin-2-like isoform X2 n=1 Tax=Channa argus TaxID=215402 RepID=UPI00352202F5
MSLTAVAAVISVFVFSKSVVHGQNDWGVTYTSTDICVLEGSTVDIHCTYTYPSRTGDIVTTVEDTFWCTKVNDYKHVDLRLSSVFAGRLQVSCNKNTCSLRITDLRKSDSDVYYFRFITNQPGGRYTGEPGVTLIVKPLQLQWFSMTQLKCSSSCGSPDHPSYIWYKNGQKTWGETSLYPDKLRLSQTDSYTCALKGREDFPSTSVCGKEQTCNTVIYTDRRICVFKGSSVDISCTYTSVGYITSKFWFSPERSRQWQNPSQPEDLSKDSQYSGRVQVTETETGRSTLRITDLRETDSAQYHFKFITWGFEWRSSLPGTTLTVTDPDLQVIFRSFSTWTKLKCHSSCRLPVDSSYIWYKNGENMRENQEEISIYPGNYYTNSYSCAVKGHEDCPSPSVCVRGESCNTVIYTDRRICVFKGSSVDISCTYTSVGYITSKFWFSPERSRQWQNPSQPEDLSKDSQYSGRVRVFETETGRSTLRITDLRDTDSAQYHFKFITQSFEWRSSLPGTTLTVTGLQVQVIRLTVQESHTEAELECHSSCRPAARLSYVWYKNGDKITKEENSYKDQFYPGDIISCALKGHQDYSSPPVYALKVPSVSVSPQSEIMEGSSVTLNCSSDGNSAANYTWYRKNQTVVSKGPQLVFSSIQSSDSGQYYCTAENELGRRTSEDTFINVKYAPKLPSVSVSPSAEIVEGSSVNLTCSSDANPAANYTWYRKNQTLHQGSGGSYYFSSITSEDSGIYYCMSENQYGHNKSSCITIDVQYPPKLPSVSVSPSAEIVEGSSVNLTCSSDANPAANYTWYKENEDSPKAYGQIFTITDFRSEHSGNYYCEAQNTRGRSNSTLYLIHYATWKSTAAGATVAVLLVAILPFVFIFIRTKRASKPSSEPGEGPDNRDESLQEEQDTDLHYASVHFDNQSDSVYSNIGGAQPRRHKEEEEVEYAKVKRSGIGASRIEESEEDPAALYSTVNKTRRTNEDSTA